MYNVMHHVYYEIAIPRIIINNRDTAAVSRRGHQNVRAGYEQN